MLDDSVLAGDFLTRCVYAISGKLAPKIIRKSMRELLGSFGMRHTEDLSPSKAEDSAHLFTTLGPWPL